MLDSILDGLKDQAIGAITKEAGIDASQAESTLPLAGDAIKEGLMGAATSGNFGQISDMMNMFSGNEATSGLASFTSNPLFAGILKSFLGKITGSLGLGEGVANSIASAALPMLMGKVAGEVTKDGGGFDLAGITKLVGSGALSGLMGGASDASGALGGIAKAAKGLLGGFGK